MAFTTWCIPDHGTGFYVVILTTKKSYLSIYIVPCVFIPLIVNPPLNIVFGSCSYLAFKVTLALQLFSLSNHLRTRSAFSLPLGRMNTRQECYKILPLWYTVYSRLSHIRTSSNWTIGLSECQTYTYALFIEDISPKKNSRLWFEPLMCRLTL